MGKSEAATDKNLDSSRRSAHPDVSRLARIECKSVPIISLLILRPTHVCEQKVRALNVLESNNGWCCVADSVDDLIKNRPKPLSPQERWVIGAQRTRRERWVRKLCEYFWWSEAHRFEFRPRKFHRQRLVVVGSCEENDGIRPKNDNFVSQQ